MAIEKYFRLTSLEDNNVISINNTDSKTNTVNIEYRTDLNPDWQSYSVGTQLTLPSGGWIELRNDSGNFCRRFSIGKRTRLSGDIRSLINYNEDIVIIPTTCFAYAFLNQPVTSFVLPEYIHTLQWGAMTQMYKGCKNLGEQNLKLTIERWSDVQACDSLFMGSSLNGNVDIKVGGNFSSRSFQYMFNSTNIKELKFKSTSRPRTDIAVELAFKELCSYCPNLVKADIDLDMSLVGAKGLYNMLNQSLSLATLIWRSDKWVADDTITEWFISSNTGAFLYTDKNLDVSSIPRDWHHIPSGWKIAYLNEKLNLSIGGKKVASASIDGNDILIMGGKKWKGLTFTCDTGVTKLWSYGTSSSELLYSTDAINWSPMVKSSSAGAQDGTVININPGQKYYLKAVEGGNAGLSKSESDLYRFGSSSSSNGRLIVSGNIMSLLDGENFETMTDISNYPSCFSKLFYGCRDTLYDCSKMILPATKLSDHCYSSMIREGRQLIGVPELPAMELASYCYQTMFFGCTSLTQAPELPATTLAESCYFQMFNGCGSLNSIKIGYVGNFSSSYFGGWVSGVSSTGTLYYNGSDTTVGQSAIPSGWNVHKDWKGLKLVSEEDNVEVKIQKSASTAPVVSLQYSLDDGDSWQEFIVSDENGQGGTALRIDNGDEVCFKGTNNAIGAADAYNKFVLSGYVGAYGNINSLLDGENFETMTDITNRPACFKRLFNQCAKLTHAPELPNTTLWTDCYFGMFNGCTRLTKAPYLPATTVIMNCYFKMFENCQSLNEIRIAYTGNFSTSGAQASAFTNWVNGVSSTGTFYYNGHDRTRGGSAFPTGWGVEYF